MKNEEHRTYSYEGIERQNGSISLRPGSYAPLSSVKVDQLICIYTTYIADQE